MPFFIRDELTDYVKANFIHEYKINSRIVKINLLLLYK